MPAFVTVSVILNIGYNTCRINNLIDYDAIYKRIEEYLSLPKGRALVSVDDGNMSIIYEYSDPGAQYRGFRKSIQFAPKDDDKLIYVYGSSPVVMKPPVCVKDFRNFPEILEEKLSQSSGKEYWRVYNMALPSSDSATILDIMKETVKLRRPDIIIYFYEGGMDYETAYFAGGVKKQYYPLTLTPTLEFPGKSGVLKNIWDYIAWMNRTYLQTGLMNFLQASYLLRIDSDPFARFNGLVLDSIRKNIDNAVNFASVRDIPIIFVIPSTNLEAKPIGIYAVTQRYYDEGMKEDVYPKKIKLLMKAKDSELFTGDLRAKSQVYDMVRGQGKNKDIYVLDLQSDLVGLGKGFGYESFYDYDHMRPSLHVFIADELADFISAEDILPGEETVQRSF